MIVPSWHQESVQILLQGFKRVSPLLYFILTIHISIFLALYVDQIYLNIYPHGKFLAHLIYGFLRYMNFN